MWEAFEKAGINGIVTGAATAALFGTKAKVVVPMTTRLIPLYCATFLCGAVTSFATDGVHEFIKEEIPVSRKFNDQMSVISSTLLNGALFYGALRLYSPGVARDFGAIQAFAVGAGSEWVGSASYTQLKEKMYL